MSLNQLPIEILVRIFSYFSQKFLYEVIRNVCKSWETIAIYPKFWEHVNTTAFENRTNTTCKFIGKVAENISELSCMNSHEIRELFTETAENVKFPKVEVLSIGRRNCAKNCGEPIIEVDINKLDQLVSPFKNLKKLKISFNGYFKECKIEDIKFLEQLESISYDLFIDRFILQALEENESVEQKIDSLNQALIRALEHIPNLTEFRRFTILQDETLKYILQRYTNLEILDLCSLTNFIFSNMNYSQLKPYKLLTTLNVSETYIDEHSIEKLTLLTPNLLHLDISYTRQIFDHGFSVIAKNCPKLESFKASTDKFQHSNAMKTNAGIQAIANRCLNLKHVELKHYNLDDYGLIPLSLNCPNLETVELSSTGITDLGIEILVKECKNIQYLMLNYCLKITNESVKVIIEKCRFLHKVSFIGCTTLDRFDFDKASLDISDGHRGISGLTNIDLSKCVALNNQCLLELGRACANLKRIKLPGTNVSDFGILMLLQQCPLLTFVHFPSKEVNTRQEIDRLCAELYTNTFITNSVVQIIAQYGQNLTEINLSFNFNLDKHGLYILLTKCVSLHTIYLSVLKQGLEGKLIGLSIGDCKQLIDDADDVNDAQMPARYVCITRLCRDAEDWSQGDNVSLDIMINISLQKQKSKYEFKKVEHSMACKVLNETRNISAFM